MWPLSFSQTWQPWSNRRFITLILSNVRRPQSRFSTKDFFWKDQILRFCSALIPQGMLRKITQCNDNDLTIKNNNPTFYSVYWCVQLTVLDDMRNFYSSRVTSTTSRNSKDFTSVQKCGNFSRHRNFLIIVVPSHKIQSFRFAKLEGFNVVNHY